MKTAILTTEEINIVVRARKLEENYLINIPQFSLNGEILISVNVHVYRGELRMVEGLVMGSSHVLVNAYVPEVQPRVPFRPVY